MRPDTLERSTADAWILPDVAVLEAQLDEDEDDEDWDDDEDFDDDDWDDDDWDDEDWDEEDDEDWDDDEDVEELEAGRRRVSIEEDEEEAW